MVYATRNLEQYKGGFKLTSRTRFNLTVKDFEKAVQGERVVCIRPLNEKWLSVKPGDDIYIVRGCSSLFEKGRVFFGKVQDKKTLAKELRFVIEKVQMSTTNQ